MKYCTLSLAILCVLAVTLISGLCEEEGDGILRGPYLGQDPPGQVPEVFAPGTVSTRLSSHSYPAFSPDGKEVYWSAYKGRFTNLKIYFMKKEGDAWTDPEVAAFSGKHADGTPVFSPDGKKLFFCSTRPADGEDAPGKREIWVVEKGSNGWSEPAPLKISEQVEMIHFQCSVAANGNLYLAAERKDSKGKADIYRLRLRKGKYGKPENLGDAVNSPLQEITPFIAPDERFIIFSSISRPDSLGSADLYISFRQKDGSWSKAKNLGAPVNSPNMEAFAGLSPDGKYLFFESDRSGRDQVHWVDGGKIKSR